MKRWVSTLALLTLPLLACRVPPPSPPPPTQDNGGAAELKGLRASVPEMTWYEGTPSTLEVNYRLEWTKSPDAEITVGPNGDLSISVDNVWMLDPSEPVLLVFLDTAGKTTGRETQRVDLGDQFVAREVPHVEVLIPLASVPVDAASLKISLGRSELNTKPVSLPPRIR